jgi:hypothetical protein
LSDCSFISTVGNVCVSIWWKQNYWLCRGM